MKTEDVTIESTIHPAAVAASPFWKRRAFVASSIVFSMLLGSLSLAPVVITATSQRNRMLESAIGNAGLTATAESATGGWFAPLAFHNVCIKDAHGQFEWTIAELQTSKGMLSFILDPVHVGELRLRDSSVTVKLDDDGHWPIQSKPHPSRSELSFVIENGSLSVIVPWRTIPIVELDELHITGNIGPDANGQRMLNVDPIVLFDHRPISELHTQQNLALIAPVLSQSTTLNGTASAWLDATQISLADNASEESAESISPALAIRGRVKFHSLDAKLKETWTRQITMLVGRFSGTALPDKIQVLENSSVEFTVDKSGIFHNGMVFLLPQIAEELTFSSSGLIRLDESIDLLLTLNVPKVLPAGRPFLAMLSQISAAPIQLRVLGTVSDPQLQLPEGVNLLGELSRRIAPAQHTEEAPPLQSAVLDLIQNVGNKNPEEPKANLAGSIFNLIRAIDRDSKDKPPREKRSDKKDRGN